MGLLNNKYILHDGQYITSEEYKNILKSRNIYNQLNEYPLEQHRRQKIVNSVSNVINFIQPFETFDLRNTVIGRLISLPETPLVEIGLMALSKQFKFNVQSSLSKKYIPDINLKNIFTDKDIISFKKNWSITKSDDIDWFSRFLNTITNFYPQSFSPFNSFATKGTTKNNNDLFIMNTGQVQLDILFKNLDYNQYKIKHGLYDLNNTIINGVDFFSNQFKYDISIDYLDGIFVANRNLTNTKNRLFENFKEYDESSLFLDTFGKTKIDASNEFDHKSLNDWIIERDVSIDKNLIWGKDGITNNVNSRLVNLRGLEDVELSDNYERFNINGGLLDYTKNLLISNNGDKIDITRKVFKRGGSNKISGFQGSPLWKAPDTAPENVRGKIGLRQHTVLDQYDNFTKAIRFDGNKIYGGNKNSVIHNSVIPRIHPTLDENDIINNRNLMFSIENLAVRAISKDDKFGIIDDGTESGIMIPASEVGPNMGRLMWFAPYGIEISEQVNNTFETTTMMGRGEPIYNYQYTERGATIRFKLIIDHPPQIKDLNNYKDISEFIAFGGTSEKVSPESINELEIRIKKIEERLNELRPQPQPEPDIVPPEEIMVVFPNDYPKDSSIGNVDDIFNIMYNKFSYEVRKNVMSSDGTSFGLNEDIYCFDEKHLETVNLAGNDYLMIADDLSIDQYSCNTLDTKLNEVLFDFYREEINRKLYDIRIVTSATKLHYDEETEEEYNQKLSERRGEAVKKLIEGRLQVLFAETLNELNINIQINAIGSLQSSDNYAKPDTYNSLGAKKERSGRISFVRNGNTMELSVPELTPEEKEEKKDLEIELENLTRELKSRREEINTFLYELRSRNENAILDNFSSVTERKFYPAFFSQTPEDFHRRLTFLQQCTRQGRSRRQEPIENEDGIQRARNSVFGRQPVSVLRIGDFFNTKIIIENLTIDYDDAPWDMNPEGFGMQPMIAEITLNLKLIGGQSLEGPIAALQNAISFNHYANSTFTDKGIYNHPTRVAQNEKQYRNEVNEEEKRKLREKFEQYFSD